MQFILNADDFGRTKTVNEAIVYGFRNGYLSRTTVMVNMPYYEEAKALAREHGFFDKIGLHINIVNGEPLTEEIKSCPSFANEDGLFNGMIFKKKRLWFFLSKKEKRALREEIRAQIERFLADGFPCMHADSHGHTHTFPAINRIVLSLLREYGFRSVRIGGNLGIGFLKKRCRALLDFSNRRFNRKRNTSVLYFGSCGDIMQHYGDIHGVCEVMLHPNVYKGEVGAEWKFSFETILGFIREHGGTVWDGARSKNE